MSVATEVPAAGLLHLDWDDVQAAAKALADRVRPEWGVTAVFGVPLGGLIPAAMVATRLGLPVLERYEYRSADGRVLVVDDLVDSGQTSVPFDRDPGVIFDALFRKPHSPAVARAAIEYDAWLVFPWERARGEHPGEDAVVRLLEVIGEDPTREGLLDTPKRVVKALTEMTSGRNLNPGAILSTTFDGEQYDSMVVLRGIEFTSLCEHHLLPFTGTADVGYISSGRVVGLSKLARLVECFARRPQLQERMTAQIANALETHLEPKGVGVVVRAHHSCMGCRGVRKPTAEMVTSTLLGYMRVDPSARSEFLRLAEG